MMYIPIYVYVFAYNMLQHFDVMKGLAYIIATGYNKILPFIAM